MNTNLHTAEVLPPRALLFLGIVALHVVFAWLLTSGLMRTTLQILLPNKPIDLIRIDEKKTPPAKPVIDQSEILERVPVPVPDDLPIPDPDVPPIITAAVPEVTGGTTITEGPPAVTEQPIRLVGRNVLPNAEAYYPPAKIRTGTEGSTVVRACVNENGKLMDGAPIVEGSSGYEDFDRAALRVARDGKYARSMKGDQAVPNCHRFRVSFTLH